MKRITREIEERRPRAVANPIITLKRGLEPKVIDAQISELVQMTRTNFIIGEQLAESMKPLPAREQLLPSAIRRGYAI
jgi:hypothetical protein